MARPGRARRQSSGPRARAALALARSRPLPRTRGEPGAISARFGEPHRRLSLGAAPPRGPGVRRIAQPCPFMAHGGMPRPLWTERRVGRSCSDTRSSIDLMSPDAALGHGGYHRTATPSHRRGPRASRRIPAGKQGRSHAPTTRTARSRSSRDRTDVPTASRAPPTCPLHLPLVYTRADGRIAKIAARGSRGATFNPLLKCSLPAPDGRNAHRLGLQRGHTLAQLGDRAATRVPVSLGYVPSPVLVCRFHSALALTLACACAYTPSRPLRRVPRRRGGDTHAALHRRTQTEPSKCWPALVVSKCIVCCCCCCSCSLWRVS